MIYLKSQKSKISDDCQELRRFLKPGKNNQEDRINFVRYWANYVKTHSDEDWSEQQNLLIDAQIS